MRESQFLPTTREEMLQRGWDAVDVILVTGDAYVDHPSFGVALIGRWLEAHGYRVAVLPQPRWDTPEDFMSLGRPRLFFGITAGNLDSIVTNYSGNAKVRDQDDYSPGGNPYFGAEKVKTAKRRPDRATLIYANLARAAYGNVPVVLGGIEASLRRFVHYDYQQGKLRASILTDAKADLLVYGMGERAVLDIARRLERGQPLHGIPGTCERLTGRERDLLDTQCPGASPGPPLVLDSWDDIQNDVSCFMAAELAVDRHARALSNVPVLQRQQAMWVLQNPPAAPLTTAELDVVYALPFLRAPHPAAGDVPAYRMIRHSVTIVRGCSGNCSFCAIARHQGPVVVSRSRESVLEEVRRVTRMPDFRGTVSDLGGPTANLYGTSCAKASPCTRHDCLFPKVCPSLRTNEPVYLDLLEKASKVEGVKHVMVSSGLRMELLLRTPQLLSRLLLHHTPGALKIAPEHTEPEILRLMHKSGAGVLPQFLKKCRELMEKEGRTIRFTPYFISAHPGCTLQDMEALAKKIRSLGLAVRQFQDFTATPGTLATAMYVTGLNRDTLAPLHVPRGGRERRLQRLVLESMRPREPEVTPRPQRKKPPDRRRRS
ncbi:YgiQ family radical SAM protein [Desulforhabdus sp. TSK]|uniref:YgiQ family radical SAM protein n=1 Tax=Desulforhabdus sp. TSK TaxID=2925014 RepID=UPI001FC7C7D6|nr:YgiQ family radical SAM protein [Desulforhabdus sp. TSK]GKT09275.1 UPF0313 protein [Desulforhabdus sp. TSK]